MDLREIEAELRRQLRERPYWTGAMLFGVGWVLGRALPLRALLAVAGFGARTAILSALEGAVIDQIRPLVTKKERRSAEYGQL